jgi:hypothetical protein
MKLDWSVTGRSLVAENEAGEIGDVPLAALDDLVWTTPTSVRGVRALLSYLLGLA